VVQRELTQWFFRITAYADRLREGLTRVDWPEHIAAMQHNWIDTMHDWLVSRQRYWGVPIPMVHCLHCGEVPVPESDLPVRLPHLPDYQARDGGRSPLARVPEFITTTCPQCGGPAQQEADTMSGFACSSWYFLRFASLHYADGPFDPEAVRRWLPVDLYVGGAEHAVGHLMYARFWTKVMYDAGLVDFDEPFPVLRSQGALLAADGKRMAKSRPESVVNPDDVVARHGADAARLHTMFIAPFEASVVWDESGIIGVKRMLSRVWSLACSVGEIAPDHPDGEKLRRLMHRAVHDISQGIEAFKLNTSVSTLMEFSAAVEAHLRAGGPTAATRQAVRTLVLLMAPFAPFLAEEAWEQMGEPYSVHTQPWPGYDPALAADETVEIAVQVNGKVRDRLSLPAGATEDDVRVAALAAPGVQRYIAGKPVARVIYAPGRLVNIVSK
jgi:leucyl-tRNA synthetase